MEAGSVEKELIARASHNHPLFREDNGLVYFKLEAATRGTAYAASIKPFQCARNGRGALEALLTQFAGTDKWDAEIKKQESLLHTHVWKGQSNYGLENHYAAHHQTYVQLQATSEHIEYQLPNEHSRVGYLINSIQHNNPGLQAGLANVRLDKGPGSMRGDFETMVAHILTYCPVSKKCKAGSKRGHTHISVTFAEGDTSEISSFGSKSGVGKTGVHLRFHKHKEYQTLNPEQKSELKEWREKEVAAGRGAKSGGNGKAKDKGSEKHINSRIDGRIRPTP